MLVPDCQDCKHRKVLNFVFDNDHGESITQSFDVCEHKESVYWDSRSQMYLLFSIGQMREKGRPCGPDAILWEAKNGI